MKRAAWMAIVVSVALIGCADREEPLSATTTPAASDLSPEQLGQIGAQIQKEPNRARDILAQHGLTEETFEAQIRRVTQDPEASKRYTAAFNKPAA